LGDYAHLQKDGGMVQVGETVAAGDLIGLSGSTGFSSGPHLHFAVLKIAAGSVRQSIPVKFRTANGESTTLVEGQAYRPFVNEPGKANVTLDRPAAAEKKIKQAAGAPSRS